MVQLPYLHQSTGKRLRGEETFSKKRLKPLFYYSAFDKLHPDFMRHLKKNVTAMRTLLSAHVVPLSWYSAGFEDGQTIKTILGSKIKIKVTKGKSDAAQK